MKRMFPIDVGFDVEEQGPTLRILSLVIDIDEQSTIRFLPCNPNIRFGLGTEEEQRIMRIGPFTSRRKQSYKVFSAYFVGQLLMLDQLVGGDADQMHIFCFAMVYECLRLGWPLQYVSNALRSLPCRHQSQLVRELRILGRRLRKCEFADVIDIHGLAVEAQMSALYLRVSEAMSPRKQDIMKKTWNERFPFTCASFNFFWSKYRPNG